MVRARARWGWACAWSGRSICRTSRARICTRRTCVGRSSRSIAHSPTARWRWGGPGWTGRVAAARPGASRASRWRSPIRSPWRRAGARCSACRASGERPARARRGWQRGPLRGGRERAGRRAGRDRRGASTRSCPAGGTRSRSAGVRLRRVHRRSERAARGLARRVAAKRGSRRSRKLVTPSAKSGRGERVEHQPVGALERLRAAARWRSA